MNIIIGEITPVSGIVNHDCGHEAHIPKFDPQTVRWAPVSAIREQWPRYVGMCSQCKQQVTLYASHEHYQATQGWNWPKQAPARKAPVADDYCC